MSNKDSILYKASDIKLLVPKVKEAEGIVPTSSTTIQLALGDSLAIGSMKYVESTVFWHNVQRN